MPAVTIILPVYNVEKYIGDCIESIINQTFKDFELIIVDDSSPDKSIDIARDMLNKTSVKYTILERPNGGLSAARNTGIKKAQGDYLAFVDSDDVISPYYLETLYSDANRFNTELSIASFTWVNEQTKKEYDQRKIVGELVDKRAFLYKVLRRKVFNYFGCFLISRKYILKNNLFFDESVFFGVDQAYMWRLMVNVNRYTYNEKVVYNYFERPGSIMTATKVEKMLTGLPSLEKCAKELKTNPYFDSPMIVTRWKISALHTIAKGFDYVDFSDAVKKFNPSAFDCMKYPDVKIKAMFFAISLGNRCFYKVLRSF